MPSLPLFRIDSQSEQEQVRVVPQGELDLATAPQLEAEIARLRSHGVGSIVLDLRQLTFMDSTGLRLLLRLDASARADGSSFAIIDGEGPVRRLLELTQVAGRLDRADEQGAPAGRP